MDEQVVGPDLVLTTETDGDRTVIAIKGELDAYTAPALEEQIANLGSDSPVNIVLDLSETGFLDSSGLRAILTAHRRLAGEQSTLVLRAPSEPVTRLLEITGLTDHFPVADG
jgi:anti-sigma B factor antagonist